MLRVLRQQQPTAPWPARSTLALHLHRAGLVVTPRRVRRPGHPGRPQAPMDAPNAIWTADFKGKFKLGDGQYCYPLTVADGYSRMLLRCQGLTSTQSGESQPVFARAFAEYGLPGRIRSDNGVPFATQALGRLSPLSVWWLRLGILPDLTEPASPQQNGRHERMHRTRKAECTRPPKASQRAQQHRFDTWRAEYNALRPHESLDDATPASFYAPSPRPYPHRLPPLEYPTMKCAGSVTTAASAGTVSGSTSARPSAGSTSASSRSTIGSGTCTSDRSASAGCTKRRSGSRMPWAGSTGGPTENCYLCP